MKIKKHKALNYIKFKGKYIKGLIYEKSSDDKGGSGFLEVGHPLGRRKYVKNGTYYEESGFHKDREEDIKLLADIYSNAYKELLELKKLIRKK